jgi:hypothetical protein
MRVNKPVHTVTVADLGLGADDAVAGARQTIVSVGAAPETSSRKKSRTTARRFQRVVQLTSSTQSHLGEDNDMAYLEDLVLRRKADGDKPARPPQLLT